MTWWQRLRRRGDLDRQLDAEVRDHLERLADDHRRDGLTETEARRRARLEFGGIESVKTAAREVRGTAWLLDLWRDTRQSMRSLRATPSFTVVAVVILALGIGASAAIYSVVDAVVLRPLPFDHSERLVAVAERDVRSGAIDMDRPQNVLDWRRRQDVFTSMATTAYGGLSLRHDGAAEAESLPGEQVSWDFFAVLRAAPLLGRAFSADDGGDGKPRLAVISYALWQRRFGGAPDVVGRWLPSGIAGGDFQVIGVMPQSFVYPTGSAEPDEVWVPWVVPAGERTRGHVYGNYLHVIARLRDGVSASQAERRLNQIMAAVAVEDAAAPRDWFDGRDVDVEPLTAFQARDVRRWMFLLLGAVGFVLLLACVNVANLLLVRATTRTRELGIRAALGATRWDLARRLLVESLIISCAGAAAGIALAFWGIHALRSTMPADLPRAAAIAINARVLAVAALAAVITGVAFGLAPVLQFSRPTLGGAIGEQGRANTASRSRQWLRTSLVVSEVALAVVLLVGAGLFMTSFARVSSIDLGLDAHDVLWLYVRPLLWFPSASERSAAIQRVDGQLQEVVARVGEIPGVTTAALVGGGLPLTGGLNTSDFAIPGQLLSARDRDIDLNEVSPDYFRALRVPLRSGRFFADADRRETEPVAILNQLAATEYFGAADAVGRIVQIGHDARRVVGVVGNIRHFGPESGWRRQAFVPFAQSKQAGARLVVRASINPAAIVPAVKAAVWTTFPDVPIPETPTFEESLGSLIAERRVEMLLLGLFGALAIVIAAIGIYGVMAYVVVERTREVGVRMALGAAPTAILGSVLGRAATYLGAGLAIGLPGAWELMRLVGAFLFHVEPHDPKVYTAVAAGLVATGLVAALVPARRASRVDPVIALRAE